MPLSPRAASLFRQAVEASGESEFVFPGERSPTHIASRSVSKAMERTRDKLDIKNITMHDLRRTAGTYMSQYGVPKDVRERILNHGGMRKGSITESVYNRYEYDAEKRAALRFEAIMRGSCASRGRTRSRLPEPTALPQTKSAAEVINLTGNHVRSSQRGPTPRTRKAKRPRRPNACMENSALAATVPLRIAGLIVLEQIENRRRVRAVS